jgi:hypothetical protein
VFVIVWILHELLSYKCDYQKILAALKIKLIKVVPRMVMVVKAFCLDKYIIQPYTRKTTS